MRNRILTLACLVWLACGATAAYGQQMTSSMAQMASSRLDLQQLPGISGALTPCVGGTAGPYACNDVDLAAFVSLGDFGSGSANDIWGWTDPVTGQEFALVGLNDGTGFVDVTDPVNPVYVGKLPTHTGTSLWRDVKVYADHAFVVSEAGGHGMQVLDLNQLRDVTTPPVTFTETAHYSGFGNAHNVVVNEDTGFAYGVGTSTCSGGLHMVNIQTPTSPINAGCYSGDGYTHDAQCVLYNGPDTAHQGKEICFNSNEDTVTIVDVTNKAAPVQLSRTGYPTASYVHQGWLTDDHVIFYQDDELDAGPTRTLIWDMTDLDSPVIANEYNAATSSRDHNLYVVGDLLYETNYTTGLRILDITDPINPNEIGFFDTYTPNDGTSFNGSWSNYPFFASGTIVVSSIGEGLFVLLPAGGGPPPPPPPAFTITLKRVFVKPNGKQKAVVKWNPAEVSTAKIDFYIDRAPDGSPDARTANDGKHKLTVPSGGGPLYDIQACEKASTTLCSNVVQADFSDPIVSDEPDDDAPNARAGTPGEGLHEQAAVPTAFALRGNYPNPFNPTTLVRLDLPEAALVHVEVFDLLGRRVLATPPVSLTAGADHSVSVDGATLSSGTYVYRVIARMDGAVEVGTGEMVVVK